MEDKMFEKVLVRESKEKYPGRNVIIERRGCGFTFYQPDTIECNMYLLEGRYSYDEVLKLNALTNHSVDFGYCSELGPIALIGNIHTAYTKRNGYFRYKVQEYGTYYDNTSEYYFYAYTDEEAKKIENYIVYGGSMDGFKEVAAVATISKMSYCLDSRFEAKETHLPRVFDMDCKLKGVYTYDEAKKLFFQTENEEDWLIIDPTIAFATIGDGQHVGIINIMSWEKQNVCGFRDVWEYGAEEPEVQTISFLTDDEACKIKDFILYVYNYSSSGIGREKYQVEKYDRTLDKRFNFKLPDGRDYRLIEHIELFK